MTPFLFYPVLLNAVPSSSVFQARRQAHIFYMLAVLEKNIFAQPFQSRGDKRCIHQLQLRCRHCVCCRFISAFPQDPLILLSVRKTGTAQRLYTYIQVSGINWGDGCHHKPYIVLHSFPGDMNQSNSTWGPILDLPPLYL